VLKSDVGTVTIVVGDQATAESISPAEPGSAAADVEIKVDASKVPPAYAMVRAGQGAVAVLKDHLPGFYFVAATTPGRAFRVSRIPSDDQFAAVAIARVCADLGIAELLHGENASGLVGAPEAAATAVDAADVDGRHTEL